MHEWFAQPIAAARMTEARQRAASNRLRASRGHDLTSLLAAPFATEDRGTTRLLRRRAAAAAVGPACC